MMGYRRVRARRYKEIIAVFAKHGFGLLVKQLRLHYSLRPKDRLLDAGTAPDKAGALTGKRLKLALEELGPTFVKLGQILSIRTGYFTG
jgi:ubiquinone biosynthesis protein